MLENNHNIHYKGVTKKQEAMGSKKDFVQPRKAMKSYPRMAALQQSYRATVHTGAERRKAPGGKISTEKGGSK